MTVIDLFAHAREHDLPPKWDGHPVEWEGWRHLDSPITCPPPKDLGACARCGSLTPLLHNVGMRRIPYDGNVIRVVAARQLPRETKAALTALRCPDCLHDTVVDLWSGAVWDLDPTDYGDQGSNAP